jgi:hypothetical protein
LNGTRTGYERWSKERNAKMTKILSGAAATALAAGLLFAVPATGQKSSVSEIIVYGTDPCPRSTDDEVVVCARKPESERYRIPEKLRQGGSLQSRESWARRAMAIETYGKTGINSCSPVGPAGFTGCTQKLINEAFEERRAQTKADSPDL